LCEVEASAALILAFQILFFMSKPNSPRRTRGRAAPGPPTPSLGGLIDLDPRTWLFASVIVAICLAPVALLYWLQPGSTATSLILAGAILLPFLIFAGLILVFGGATPRRSQWLAIGFAVGGVAFAVYGGLIDSRMRAVTLFETEVPGSMSVRVGDPPPVREVRFTVEHTNVEHTLTFWPTGAGFLGGTGAVEVGVELRDPAGTPLFTRTERHSPNSSRQSTDWRSVSIPFTPATSGEYTLLITPLTVDIPRIHIRIVDPLKRDGVRMRGY
jgi:hypothetical protein